LDGLNSLTAKDKIQKLNFYGNKIKQVDFAVLLTNFPNLQYLNIENNPVSAVNLQKLSKEQLKNLVGKIKDKKFRINSYRGTVLQDLLFHLQSSGDTAHARTIQTLIETNSTKKPPARNSGRGWMIGGGIALLALIPLTAGYWWEKSKQKTINDDD
jgi:hypothetical protein